VTVRNRGRRAKVAYAVVYAPRANDPRFDAPYRISIKR
jgi:hypothetical protein